MLPTHEWKIANNGLGGWDVALSVSAAVSHSIEGMCLHVLFSPFVSCGVAFFPPVGVVDFFA